MIRSVALRFFHHVPTDVCIPIFGFCASGKIHLGRYISGSIPTRYFFTTEVPLVSGREVGSLDKQTNTTRPRTFLIKVKVVMSVVLGC